MTVNWRERLETDIVPAPPDDDEVRDAAWLEQKEQAEETTKALRRLRAQKSARQALRAEELSEVALPVPQRLDDFLTRPLEPITHRIEGLMPIGSRVLLSAQWKAGKTTLRDNLVRSLVDGDPFLNRYAVTPLPDDATVVILDFELDDQTLQRWLTDHGITNQQSVHVLPMRGQATTFDIRDEQLRARWAATLASINAAVIVLDCLRPVLDALGLDENHDAGLFLVAFDALLAEAGAREALVIHHMGHTGERARGDSRLRDWPDAEWRLVRDKDEEDPTIDDPAGARYFTAYGRDVNHPQTEVTYEPETRHLTLRATAGDRKQAAKRRKAQVAMTTVQRFVAAQPGIGKRALLTAISGHNPTISEAIELLVEDGLIRRHVQGSKHQYFPGNGDPLLVPNQMLTAETRQTSERAPSPKADPTPNKPPKPSGEPVEQDTSTTVPTVPNRAQGTQTPSVPRPLGRGTVDGPLETSPPTSADLGTYNQEPPCPTCDTLNGHLPGCPDQGDQPCSQNIRRLGRALWPWLS